MLDNESLISARRDICLKKFLEDYPSTRKLFLNSCIFSVGGSLILHCHFDTVKLKTQFPKYFKKCFDAWSGLNDVMNEIIWKNRFICIDIKFVYRSDLGNLGIMKVCDLIMDNNLFFHEDPYVTITPEQRFFIMGVVRSLPSVWKTVIKSSVCKNEIRPIPHTPHIKQTVALSRSQMSPLNRYTTLFCAKNKSLQKPNKKYQTNTQTRSLIGERFILYLSVLHLIINWENFNTKF